MTTTGAGATQAPPTVVATEPLQATDDPRADLVERGYHIARGLLDPDVLRDLRRDLLEAAGAAGWLAPGSDPGQAVPGQARAHNESDPDDYVPVYRKVQALERFHVLGRSPQIQELVTRALGEPTFSQPAKIARFTFPDTVPTAPHQDFDDVQGATDTITSWIPLGACQDGGGRLAVLAGSHLLGPLPALPNPEQGGFWIDTADLGCEWHSSDYEAGDVLLFHALTVHAAEPNRSGRVRVSVDCRWQRVADPIFEANLQPHYLRDTTWPELYEGWESDEHQWYWSDLPVTSVPTAGSAAALAERASSRLLGRDWSAAGGTGPEANQG